MSKWKFNANKFYYVDGTRAFRGVIQCNAFLLGKE